MTEHVEHRTLNSAAQLNKQTYTRRKKQRNKQRSILPSFDFMISPGSPFIPRGPGAPLSPFVPLYPILPRGP